MGRKCIVVTEKQGSHRFSYRGKNLEPRAICTDTLSHILVCDHFIHAVQMLNKDGQFLKYLRQKQTHDVDCFFYKKLKLYIKSKHKIKKVRMDITFLSATASPTRLYRISKHNGCQVQR